jgi:hypothetical protein
VQDYRRNGWYAVGTALITIGAGWLIGWGITVANATKDSTTHFLIPATYSALVATSVGFLIFFAVMFNGPSWLWWRVKPHKEAGQQLPGEPDGSAPLVTSPQPDTGGTVTFRNFVAGGNSNLKVRSSADTFADGGGTVGHAKLDAEHFPGHPERFSRHIESQGEQERPPQAEEGTPGERDGRAD